MDVAPFVEHLRRDLLAAAESGGSELVDAAHRLGFALDAAARLAVMEAVSQACAEITAEMPAGGVDVRLDGRELAFVVDAATPGAPAAAGDPTALAGPALPVPAGPDDEADDAEAGATARITLRLPEAMKTRAEDAAAAAGQSLNTWLVGAVRAASRPATDEGAREIHADPFGGFPFDQRRGPGGRRLTGWV